MSIPTLNLTKISLKKILVVTVLSSLSSVALAADKAPVPADKFDLSQWNITLPIDKDLSLIHI